MIRRVIVLGCVFLAIAVAGSAAGCTSSAQHEPPDNGQWSSQNLWPTSREERAGDH
jgi:hypothetical protein